MKKINTLLILFLGLHLFAQETMSTMTLTPIVFAENSSHEQVSPRVKKLLKNKMRRVASKYGFSSGVVENRHIMFPDIQVLTKDIIPSAPPKVSLNIEFTFYIADYDTRTIYASESFELMGVGATETKAYYNALAKINANNKKFKTFMETGKRKIIDYYNTHCDLIIKKAQTEARIGKEYEGLSILTRVPSDCDQCYSKAMDASIDIYKKLEDKLCEENFSRAQAIWATNQTYSGARRIEPFLSKILPRSSCYSRAQALVNDMINTLKEKEDRLWNYRMTQESNEKELRTMQMRMAHEVAMERIDKQPRIVYRNSWWW